MSTPIYKAPGSLPYSCYPPDPQTLNVDIITLASMYLNQNFPGVYVGATEPPSDQRDRVWFHTVSTKWYYYINGKWQRKYDPPALSGENRIIKISVDDYNAEQGGDPTSTGVGDSSGPLWIEDTDMQGRMPVGAGPIPGTDPAVTIALGAIKDSNNIQGEYLHKLTAKEMMAHFHGVGTDGAAGGGDPPIMISRAWSVVTALTRRLQDSPGTGTWGDNGTFASGTMSTTNPQDDTANLSDGHITMPPYRGRLFVVRTARVYVSPPF